MDVFAWAFGIWLCAVMLCALFFLFGYMWFCERNQFRVVLELRRCIKASGVPEIIAKNEKVVVHEWTQGRQIWRWRESDNFSIHTDKLGCLVSGFKGDLVYRFFYDQVNKALAIGG